ncbi:MULTISPECIES: DUF3889 domain-containing protein [Bacillaceae]|uniref:DUF3889 domain-containing protein n=1 Tax=Bacillaceae TaxID=186817 RepID=UPI000C79369B|nr:MULTISPECIES: DUF3889 domain-containing protein [Bacillaceae]PLR65903.1 hypothetical protein CYJ36_21080 [Bacillus sp. UMB0893]
MKIGMNIFLIFCMAVSASVLPVQGHAETKTQSYEEFGREAMKKAKETFPDAQIVDYLHVGKKRKGETSIETFKLTLKENNKPFEVFVFIEYNEKTKKVIKVTLEKVS